MTRPLCLSVPSIFHPLVFKAGPEPVNLRLLLPTGTVAPPPLYIARRIFGRNGGKPSRTLCQRRPDGFGPNEVVQNNFSER